MSWKGWAKSVLLIGSVVLGTARPVQAATITVTRTDDAVGTSDGVTLREALDAANTDASVDGSAAGSGADTIIFDPTAFAAPTTITLGGTELPIASAVTISRLGAAQVTISGNDLSRVFNIDDSNAAALADVTISGLTLTNGRSSMGGGAIINSENLVVNDSVITQCTGTTGGDGGGILTTNGSRLALNRSTVSACSLASANRGGGVAGKPGSTIALVDCTISQNMTNGKGGGVALYGSSVLGGTASIQNCVITGNTSGSRGGGGFFYNSAVSISNSTVSGNMSGNRGGGLQLYKSTGSIDACTISGNTSVSRGGAADLYKSNFTINACTISGNSATNRGGGLFLYKGSNTIANTTISGNSSTGGSGYGGGVMLYKGTHTLQNCTISNNQSSQLGGNVYIRDVTTNATIQNCTITGASANDGINVASGTLFLKSTLVAGNSPYDVNAAVDTTSDHNLIGVDGGLTGISNADANGNQVGTGVSPLNPLLGALANNGGPTQTHLLMVGSPAIGTGSNPANLTTDQRGFARTANATPDVGAVEMQPPSDIALSSSTVPENSAAGTAVGTLSATDSDPGEQQAFTLVAGTGSADNASFQIVGAELRTVAPFDFETKNSYSIRVRATDPLGFFFEKALTITVTDVNEAPTDVALSSASVPENSAVGTPVGTLSATDPDANSTFTFSLVAGTGSTDNASFQVVGNALQTAAVFDFEAKSSFSIRVRAIDAPGLFVEKALTISVTNVNEPPVIASASFSPAAPSIGQKVVFAVVATDPEGAPVTVGFNYGDGTSDATGSHAFATAGTFTVVASVSDGTNTTTTALTVTVSAGLLGDTDGDGFSDAIETALTTDPNDPASSPFDLSAPVAADTGLTIKRLTIGLAKNPKANRLVLNGSLPVPNGFAVQGKPIILSIGGLVRAFVPDKQGRAPAGEAFDLFRFGRPAKGRLAFNATLRRGDYSNVQREAGGVRVIVIFKGSRYELVVPVK